MTQQQHEARQLYWKQETGHNKRNKRLNPLETGECCAIRLVDMNHYSKKTLIQDFLEILMFQNF